MIQSDCNPDKNCILQSKIMNMDSSFTNDTMQIPRAKSGRKSRVTQQTVVSKTPENELATVEEFFDAVWNRYLEKNEKLQG